MTDIPAQIWDPRQKESVDYLETSFPVTAVAMSEAGNEIFSGSIDNDIKVWHFTPPHSSRNKISQTRYLGLGCSQTRRFIHSTRAPGYHHVTECFPRRPVATIKLHG